MNDPYYESMRAANPPPMSNDSRRFTLQSAPSLPAPPPHILPKTTLEALCKSWLLEDTPSFDPASAALPPTRISATLYAKSSFVLSGLPFAETLFTLCDCESVWLAKEGVFITASNSAMVPIAKISGPAPGLLRAERPALNALSECSGVATAARKAVVVKERTKWGGVIAATRKTTPGLRLLQKYGVIVGGMDPHRMDLSQMAMLKDNHIAAASSVENAIASVKRVLGFAGKVEVEAADLSEAVDACAAGADVIMLDNFQTDYVQEAAQIIKNQFPSVIVEVSGGVDIDGLEKLLVKGIDVVSFSVYKFREMVDVSLRVE